MTATSPIAQDAARCRNCGAAAPSAYCPECGQKTVLHPPTVPEFLHELVGHYFAFEGKLWRTLLLLTLRPGRLTTEYLQGRRSRYIIPLRLYLSASFVFFLAVKVIVPEHPTTNVVAPLADGTIVTSEADITRHGSHLEIKPRDPNEAPVEIDLKNASDEGLLACLKPDAKCSSWKTKMAAAVNGFKTDPDAAKKRLVDRLQDNASYALFAMLPMFAFLMSLVYHNRRLYYGEHLVFALHLHTFWFLAALILAFAPKPVSDVMSILILVYGVWAMHQVYGGRWRWTIARAVFVSALYTALVSIISLALVMYLVLT